jgi:hypothetical protein
VYDQSQADICAAGQGGYDLVQSCWLVSQIFMRHLTLQRSQYIVSLVSGPLSATCAFEAKVATCPKDESSNPQHTLCLYMPDVYDKVAVTEVRYFYFALTGLSYDARR